MNKYYVANYHIKALTAIYMIDGCLFFYAITLAVSAL